MRPIDKGPAPNTYSDYREAKPDLIARIDEYCSYCERHLETHLAVEHVKPKEKHSALRNKWSNFLLACNNCNSTKGDTDVVLNDYFWPHRDSTLRAFLFSKGGTITPHPALTPRNLQKATDTLILLGLDKQPGNSTRIPTGADSRWRKRNEAWELAVRSRKRLAQQTTNRLLREQIVETATTRGMFCIWWTVFENDIDMRRRLRNAFEGTDPTAFDPHEEPVARGQL